MNKKISFVGMTAVLRRIWVLVLLMMAASVEMKAQQTRFVYLQTDNSQPFYIRYNSKITSSAATGYLIMGKLPEGTVRFFLGFPRSNQEELEFEVTIANADKGYLLKQLSDKGWALYDLQQSTFLYTKTNAPANGQQGAVAEPGNTSSVAVPAANDPFANMLSAVTQDTTVKQVVVLKKELPRKDSVKVAAPPVATPAPQRKDSTAAPIANTPVPLPVEADTPINAANATPVPVVPPPPADTIQWTAPARTTVTLMRRFTSREGVDLVFIVAESGMADTVRMFVAGADEVPEQDSAQQVAQQPVQPVADTPKLQLPVVQDTVAVVPAVVPPVAETTAVANTVAALDTTVIRPLTTAPAAVPNSNCKQVATDDDFLRLRKRMASQNKEEGMVEEARKTFKTRCFTSQQLRNLSVLFLSDEWRYRFFDTALPYVVDFAGFPALGETITSEYYRNRFKALLPEK